METGQCCVYSFLFLAAFFTLVKSQDDPTFLQEPVNSNVAAGSSVMLYCQVENTQAPVQWTRNGFVLGPDRELTPYPRYQIVGNEELGEYNLLIVNAQLDDDAVFQCQIGATATTPGKMSARATLTVLLSPGQPVIDGSVEHVINQYQTEYLLNVTEGVAYNVTCHANHGKPAAQITWYIENEEHTGQVYYEKVVEDGKKTENAIGRLQMTPSKDDHEKKVRCSAANPILKDPHDVTVILKVLYRPEIILTAEPSRKVKAGGTVVFKCEGEANPNDIRWKWREGETEIEGATGNTFVMSNINKEKDKATVTCEATNSVGSSVQTHTLNVEFPPYFTSEPEHVAAEQGDDVTLECNVNGNPIPSIKWTRAGSPRVLSRSETYRIASVGKTDFGVYTCTASSVDFPPMSKNVHLLKKGRPRITSEVEQSARIGETAALKCEAISVPAAEQIVWSRDGKPLDVDQLKRYSLREEETLHGKKSILEIQSSQDKDFGQYNCTVVNSYGSATVLIEFSQEEAVSLTYILLAVLLTVAVIIVVLITVYVLYRRRKTGSEYGSDSSENTLQKKEEKPEISHISSTQNGGPVDGWADSTVKYMNEQNRVKPYNYTATNLENPNPYPSKQPRGFDYQDGYGNRGYAPYPSNPYGTFPGPANHYTPRYASSEYGVPSNYSDIGTYGRSRTPQPHYAASDYGTSMRAPYSQPHYAQSDYGGATLPRAHMHAVPRAHAPANLDSRLATNV